MALSLNGVCMMYGKESVDLCEELGNEPGSFCP